jgi:hypothetical protein
MWPHSTTCASCRVQQEVRHRLSTIHSRSVGRIQLYITQILFLSPCVHPPAHGAGAGGCSAAACSIACIHHPPPHISAGHQLARRRNRTLALCKVLFAHVCERRYFMRHFLCAHVARFPRCAWPVHIITLFRSDHYFFRRFIFPSKLKMRNFGENRKMKNTSTKLQLV